MRLIDADAIAPRLDPRVLIEALREAHRDGDMGEVERMLIAAPGTGNSVLTWVASHGRRASRSRRRRCSPATAAPVCARTSSRS